MYDVHWQIKNKFVYLDLEFKNKTTTKTMKTNCLEFSYGNVKHNDKFAFMLQGVPLQHFASTKPLLYVAKDAKNLNFTSIMFEATFKSKLK